MLYRLFINWVLKRLGIQRQVQILNMSNQIILYVKECLKFRRYVHSNLKKRSKVEFFLIVVTSTIILAAALQVWPSQAPRFIIHISKFVLTLTITYKTFSQVFESQAIPTPPSDVVNCALLGVTFKNLIRIQNVTFVFKGGAGVVTATGMVYYMNQNFALQKEIFKLQQIVDQVTLEKDNAIIEKDNAINVVKSKEEEIARLIGQNKGAKK